MMKRTVWRPILAVSIVITTAGVFANYFASHPELRSQLSEISGWLFAAIFGLYILFIITLWFINSATVRLCNTSIPARDNLLLTMYSSVINFFGPLQSGPAFRAVYLKQKYNVSLIKYANASLLYYLVYGILSGAMLLSGLIGWWAVVLTIGVLCALYPLCNSNLKHLQRFKSLSWSGLRLLVMATVAQVIVLTVIYLVELRSLDQSISLQQTIIYTGAANLALFVSITPGAIGFRESFLLFSQRLHNVDTSTIVAANTIDRAVYIVFLLVLAIIIVLAHAQKRFSVTSSS